jgi:thioredoxin:protein disulfide reductase
MKKYLYLLGLALLLAFTTNNARAEGTSKIPLSAKQAFSVTTEIAPKQTVLTHFQIAPGCYLYREHMNFKVLSPKGAKIYVQYPQGLSKKDPVLGAHEIYKGLLTIPATISTPQTHSAKNKIKILVSYQGCSEGGFCYPPTHTIANLNLAKITAALPADRPVKTSVVSEQDKVMQMLMTQKLGFILLGFLGFGLLLAFTPCVLPMLPILSAIIVGQDREMSTLKAFKLSLVYVFGMSINYAMIGVLAGLLGSHFQEFFQAPAFLIVFSVLFVILAFSLFGFYELQLPHGVHQRVVNWSNHHQGGTYVGVGVMGFLSTLVVSPCVTAPLVGALGYIGRTGDAMLGGTALFVMGIGMGIPLMVFGTSEGKLLPKAGPWMKDVKAFFGILMLGVAIDLMQRILPDTISILLWGALAITLGVYLIWFSGLSHHIRGKVWRFLGWVPIAYASLLFVNLSFGIHNMCEPLAFVGATQAAETPVTFKIISSMDELTNALNDAKKAGKWLILDFSAKWCVSCQEMDRTTFSNNQIKERLKNAVLLRVDLTHMTNSQQTLQEKLNVVAPPTVLFFDKEGNEQKNLRIVGAMGATEFMERLKGL